jgi:hypothetical protein
MVIANPIYDVAFKFLMDDERVAKFFIGTLLEETIEEVSVRPQEYTYTDQLAGLAVFRLDFVATIRTKEGGYKKVLVEIQKAKNRIDLMRFRNYLGEQYRKEDEVEGKKQPLPIVTIYLLGFLLKEIESSVIKVNRHYIDLLTHQVIDKKSDFIERLTHDCFVVQLSRIDSRVGTKLEKLLSVFEQHYFIDGNNTIKEYKHSIDDDNISRMVEKLHYVGTEPTERKKIEDEKEAYRVLDWATESKANELKQIIVEKDKALEDKDKELEDKDKELEDKDKELEDNKKALKDNKRLIEELKRRLGEK